MYVAAIKMSTTDYLQLR